MKKTTPKPTVRKSNTKSKTVMKSSKRLSWKQILPVSLLLATAGFFLVSLTQASGPSSYITGYMKWKHSGTTKVTRSFSSSSGVACVAANFNTSKSSIPPNYNDNYVWKIQKYSYGQWTTVGTSSQYQANGNRDHACFQVGTKKSKSYYRVAFDTRSHGWDTDRSTIHGNYWVWGYNHN